jgi:pilus assembly protein CpaC
MHYFQKFFLPLLALLLILLAPPTSFAQSGSAQWLDIELGKSIVLETPRIPKTIAITDPTVANMVPMGVPNQIQVQGLSIGSTDLIIQFGQGQQPLIYELTVHRDLSDLIRRIDAIVRGEPPIVYPLQQRIVVEGPVDDLDTLEQVAMVTAIYDDEFVNLMTVRGDHQVQLEVVFAEASRSGLRSLGINSLWGNSGLAVAISNAQQGGGQSQGGIQMPGVNTVSAGLIASPGAGFQVAGYFNRIDLGMIMAILSEYQLSKILSQPTMVTLSGQTASFLAGGQIPIPAPGQGMVSITYRDYGVSLEFVPTVLAGNVIDLQVAVSVSELDYGKGTTIGGASVPGFITRSGKSHLRIQSGLTFAMAGMLSERQSMSRAEIPGLGNIPILGALFRTVQHTRDETELMIFVTPRLVRPLAPSEVPPYPGTTENNNPGDLELFFFGMDHKPGSRTAQPTAKVGLKR